jgi:hypothetical protein
MVMNEVVVGVEEEVVLMRYRKKTWTTSCTYTGLDYSNLNLGLSRSEHAAVY